MSTALAPAIDPAIIEQVLIRGDLKQLTPAQKLGYYKTICESLGLNPHTQPLAYITLNGREVLYAKKDATEQLRKLHGVSIDSVTSQKVDDVFVVTATARDKTGRTDAATGAVAIGNLKGEALANALMKAETKAKRRVTLSICGLGLLDETEAEPLAAKESQYTVEAQSVEPKALEEMPEGTCRVLKVEPKRKGNFEWANVTYVMNTGEEHVAIAKMGYVALLEQFAQNGTICELGVEPNKKNQPEIVVVAKYHELVAVPEPTMPESVERVPDVPF